MRVLLALNRSLDGAPAEDETIARHWPPGSVVRVLTVLESPFMYNYTPETASTSFVRASQDLEPAQRSLLQEAAAVARSVANDSSTRNLAVERNIRQGVPGPEIVDEAKQWGADLIVLGPDNRKGIERVLTRDIDSYVVTHAPCSVEVVRAPSP